MILLLCDILLSSFALMRQNQRSQNIAPKNHFEEIIDKFYPDSYLNKIYNNRIIIN